MDRIVIMAKTSVKRVVSFIKKFKERPYMNEILKIKISVESWFIYLLHVDQTIVDAGS
ncbi:hypothetical protein [Dellaglioa algida]|uniref:hypothetical protein n=1 Tax=Dellaglioa algida TaxID=105612 RepID=UPI000BDB5A75|nr:hypothetical protein [Dellaglioa algida]MDK1718809.1 hypothetical protein [Dellaglioa algida]MDK1728244.1 hypothetical protein [Dellaglioa algida]MDK1730041.1 hypothetical protein [Dellaglioa algida]MDK1735932.1 hypothetical protein [Dellaglioa algida]MDK1737606.1 hypothetical protein [Dellaglioa algida]